METPLPPCKGAGRGVYYHLARRTGVRESAEDLENRILRIQDGFNEKNKLASNQFEFFRAPRTPVRDARRDRTESLILAQDERWRRA